MKISISLLLSFLLLLSSGSVSAKIDTLRLQGSKGKLMAWLQTPDGFNTEGNKKIPLVMILHGLTGNKNEELLFSLADSLENRGVASIRFDFNGHGESDGDFSDMTISNEIEDAGRVYDYVSSLPWVKDISLWGHSQGGVVSAMLAGKLGKKRIRRVVLVAPAGVLRDDAIRGNFFDSRFNPMDPPETVRFWGGHKLGREYIKDAYWLPIYETAAKYSGPVCIIHGMADTTVPFTYGIHFKEVMPRSEFHLIEGEGHVLSNKVKEVTELATSFLTNGKF